MKNLVAALSATALIGFAPFALAASSTDLTVTGTITPSACTPLLSGNGEVQLGKISAKDLNPDPDRFTRLDKQFMQLTVTCDAATRFALNPTDNKAGTSFDDPSAFGLGLTGAGEKVGEFWIATPSVQADEQPAVAIVSFDDGENWMLGDGVMTGMITSVSSAGTPLPMAATNVTMELEIAPIIAPTNDLTLTEDVTIDGSVTIDVKYL